MNDALLSALNKRFPAHAHAIPALLPALESGEPAAFVLRYRRDLLGDLDDAAFRRIRSGYREERELQKRRGATGRALHEAEGAAPSLVRRVQQTRDFVLLEDLIRPIRESRRGSAKRSEDPMTPVAHWVLSGASEAPVLPPKPETPSPVESSPVESSEDADAPAESAESAAVAPDADATEASAAPDEAVTTEEAGVAVGALAAEEAVVAEEVGSAEPPAAVAAPVVADEPAAAEPAVQDESVAVAEPVVADDSTSVDATAVVEAPAVTEEPVAVQEPVAVAETPAPEAVEETAEEPAAAEAPAATDEPAPAATGPVTLAEVLAPFCGADGAHPTVQDQTERLCHLVSDLIGADAIARQTVRNLVRRKGLLKTSGSPGREVKPQYAPAIGISEPIGKVKPRTLLLVRRGQKAGAVHAHVQLEDADLKGLIEGALGVPAEHPHADLMRAATLDALARVLLPAASVEVINERKRVAERALIPTFTDTLRERLMTAPAGQVPIVAVAPGSTGTARLLIIDADGRPGRTEAVHPLPPRNEGEEAAKVLFELLTESGAKLVAVPASGRYQALREWVIATLDASAETGAVCALVHEAAATALAGSAVGKAECPELPASARAALSLGRYVQDPMAEIARYDLTRLVLGQNQRDVDQGELRRALEETLEECVGHVGVDVNRASVELLASVPGLDAAAAAAIVAKRDAGGPFPSLQTLREAEGLSEECWQRASGFLRIRGGESALDATQAHPTGAAIATSACERLGRSISELQGAFTDLKALDPAELAGETHKPEDVISVLKALAYGAADPRGVFVPPVSNPGVRRLRDVEEGMELDGVIASLAKFGAFVDVGIHQQGLVHVSELSHTFIEEPAQAASVGERVRVKVLGVDAAKRRLSLSVKALLAPPPRVESVGGPGGRGGPGGPGGRYGGGGGGGRGRGGPGGRGGRGGGGGGGGGGRRSNVPTPRDIPRESDPFFLQLEALRAQLGMEPTKSKTPPAEKKKRKARKPADKQPESAPADVAPADGGTPAASAAPVADAIVVDAPVVADAQAEVAEAPVVAAGAESVSAESVEAAAPVASEAAAETPAETPAEIASDAPAEPEAPAAAEPAETPAETPAVEPDTGAERPTAG